ncbi:DivIVA domain-containing protein [Mycobacteroides abscessus]|uniref:DivIVA domain-containing protein n=1 Tax=Mycobacteroides abscessus TaxID=36809 RepID=UPI0009A6FBB6|nr:DivIVA domain-containing protein [Mycobacteroides abscessus]
MKSNGNETVRVGSHRISSDFSRARNGYNQAEVDNYIRELDALRKQDGRNGDLLKEEISALKGRLEEANSIIRSLEGELSTLRNTPAPVVPQATADRVSKMLSVAIEEAAAMEKQAREEAANLITGAHADAEAIRLRHKELIAEVSARQSSLEKEYEQVIAQARLEAKQIVEQAVRESDELRARAVAYRENIEKDLDAEARKVRADAQAEASRRLAIADEQMRSKSDKIDRSLDEVKAHRIVILEQLVNIHAKLEEMPSILESAYAERDSNPVTISTVTSGQLAEQKEVEDSPMEIVNSD